MLPKVASVDFPFNPIPYGPPTYFLKSQNWFGLQLLVIVTFILVLSVSGKIGSIRSIFDPVNFVGPGGKNPPKIVFRHCAIPKK